MLAFVRSFGDCRSGILLVGASGGTAAGAGEGELTGESRTEQEIGKATSGRRESIRGRRGS